MSWIKRSNCSVSYLSYLGLEGITLSIQEVEMKIQKSKKISDGTENA